MEILKIRLYFIGTTSLDQWLNAGARCNVYFRHPFHSFNTLDQFRPDVLLSSHVVGVVAFIANDYFTFAAHSRLESIENKSQSFEYVFTSSRRQYRLFAIQVASTFGLLLLLFYWSCRTRVDAMAGQQISPICNNQMHFTAETNVLRCIDGVYPAMNTHTGFRSCGFLLPSLSSSLRLGQLSFEFWFSFVSLQNMESKLKRDQPHPDTRIVTTCRLTTTI